MDACMTSQLNLALIRKLRTWIIYVRGFFLSDMLSMGTARHWQTFGQLVQELNVCTVAKHLAMVDLDFIYRPFLCHDEA